jgi:hypothetical protein
LMSHCLDVRKNINPYSRRPPDNHLLDPLPVDWSSSCATGPLSFLRGYHLTLPDVNNHLQSLYRQVPTCQSCVLVTISGVLRAERLNQDRIRRSLRYASLAQPPWNLRIDCVNSYSPFPPLRLSRTAPLEFPNRLRQLTSLCPSMDNMERQPINRGICIHLHVKILHKNYNCHFRRPEPCADTTRVFLMSD